MSLIHFNKIGLKIEQDRCQARLGIGDRLQFSSIPENFFRATGKKLIDINKHWIFDYNPYIIRDVIPEKTINIWDEFCHNLPDQLPDERTMLLSNAEAFARHFDYYPVVLNRPRLYKYEEYPYENREYITFHTKGVSHGRLPDHVVEHVLNKYGDKLVLIGHGHEWDYPFPCPKKFIQTKELWELAEVISKARMHIGVDSGPGWIAMCYPDVVVKIVRMFPSVEALKSWVPLELCRLGSYWDDRARQVYNPSEDDAGFTWSYKRI